MTSPSGSNGSEARWSGLVALPDLGSRVLSAPAALPRVPYCGPWHGNAVADVRGRTVEDCGIVGVGGYDARSRALR